MFGASAVIWKDPTSGWRKTFLSTFAEIRKNILVLALKKAKEDANVKASIVGDKLVVNGRRYTSNKIPTQWRNDEVQQQDVPPQEIQQQDVPAQESQQQDVSTQEIRDPEDPTTLEIEPSQETSEITYKVFLQTFI